MAAAGAAASGPAVRQSDASSQVFPAARHGGVRHVTQLSSDAS